MAVAGLAVFLAVAPVSQAGAAPAAVTFNLTIKPAAGPAGTTFAIGWTLRPNTGCKIITFSSALTSIPSSPGSPPPNTGSVSATAPGTAKAGTYAITGTCGETSAVTRFTVTSILPPTTTTTTTTTRVPPVTTTTPPVTTVPPVTTIPPGGNSSTTRPPVTVITTRPGFTTTPTISTDGTTTQTVTSTSDGTAPPPGTTPEIPVTDVPEPDGGLELDRKSVRPGDPLVAKGTGCEPNRTVLLTSEGDKVGESMSDGNGEFTAPVEFERVQPGRHTVFADCGVVLSGSVDQLVTSSTSGNSGTLVVLVFFVLAGAALIRVA
ncbi:hypothetical protein V5P93_000373 [Actinokineospora auranticolor]|uniref:hypothetical protein n=1 Tax=Actinokineospora auranticolor TaxID=155976 RepID=UPI001FE6F27E|nr:hypothetical protein [Actinokineospora auranticolor]